MPTIEPQPAAQNRIEKALTLLNEELDETFEYLDAEDGAIDPQWSTALEDKILGLHAAIYVLEQVHGCFNSYGIQKPILAAEGSRRTRPQPKQSDVPQV